MSSKLANTISGVVLLVVCLVAFGWLWNISRNTDNVRAVSENLKSVEVDTVKSEAKDLVSDRENVANIPIPVPIGKMGQDNPFAAGQ